MPQHKDNELPSHGPEKIDASHGYERSDVKTSGIVVFLTALGIFVAVTGALCWLIGKGINVAMLHEDKATYPNNKWTTDADKQIRELGNLPSSPELQNKVAELAKQFPTPRVQDDDGNQDVMDLHAREDLLLDHYTRIDGQAGKVRIPIDRAMELIAQRGLPVAPAQNETLMAGDQSPVVHAPLTTGFARTAYEQQEVRGEKVGIGNK
jgi:hypothetical protein